MEFKNVEKFEKWLKEKRGNDNFDIDAYLDDVAKQYGNTGIKEYELSSSESKSGNTETYDYDTEEVYDEKHDCYEITIIF